jgi:glycosyltransferase involved in cell wall biosynthesis
MNVLLLGHACGPGMGSEPGNTWNWALYLSHRHQVCVLTHPQHRSKIDTFLKENPNPNLRFVWVTVSSPIDTWNPAESERGIRVHYLIWLSEAYKVALQLCSEIAFDIAHHVSWATINAPPPLWLLPVPMVWGPVGGGQSAPFAFLPYFGWRTWRELLRTFRVRAMPFLPKLHKALAASRLTFVVNSDTERLLKRAGGTRLQQFLDCGLPPEYVPAGSPSPGSLDRFVLLWAGRLEPHKALVLAVHALSKVRDLPVDLVVAGTGPLRARLEKLVNRLQLKDRVQFLGFVPYEKMPALFGSSNAFLFTSLRDSFGAVVLEAMAHGLPIVTLDHQGVGTFVPAAAGVKVPVTVPEETIECLARGIRRLASSQTLCRAMGTAAWQFAKEQTWDRRTERMGEIYEDIVSAHARDSSAVSLLEEELR